MVLGLTGPLMKSAIRAGIGVGEFLVLFGITLAIVGALSRIRTGAGKTSRGAVITGIVTGILWSLGTGLNLVALGRFDANISQLTPLFNMNTLVVVLLGLWIYKEHQMVRPLPLVLGAGMVVFGAVFVTRA